MLFKQEYQRRYCIYRAEETSIELEVSGQKYEMTVPLLPNWFIAIDKDGEVNMFEQEPLLNKTSGIWYNKPDTDWIVIGTFGEKIKGWKKFKQPLDKAFGYPKECIKF